MPTLLEVVVKNLESLRKARGFTQDTLAEKTALSRGTIARLETGAVFISADSIKRLATALGVEETDLVHPGGPPKVLEVDHPITECLQRVNERVLGPAPKESQDALSDIQIVRGLKRLLLQPEGLELVEEVIQEFRGKTKKTGA